MTEQNAESFRFQNPFGRFVRAEITSAWDLIKGNLWKKLVQALAVLSAVAQMKDAVRG